MKDETERVGISRKFNFTMIPDAILDDMRVSKTALLTFLAIARFADKNRTCYPSLNTIGRKARLSRSSVQTGISELMSYGYLKKSNRVKPGAKEADSNTYELIDVPEFKEGIPESGTPYTGERYTLYRQAVHPIPESGKEGENLNYKKEQEKGREEGVGLAAYAYCPSQAAATPSPLPLVSITQEETAAGIPTPEAAIPTPETAEPDFLEPYRLVYREFTTYPLEATPNQIENLKALEAKHGRDNVVEAFRVFKKKRENKPRADFLYFFEHAPEFLFQLMRETKAVTKPRTKPVARCPVCGGETPIDGDCPACGYSYDHRYNTPELYHAAAVYLLPPDTREVYQSERFQAVRSAPFERKKSAGETVDVKYGITEFVNKMFEVDRDSYLTCADKSNSKTFFNSVVDSARQLGIRPIPAVEPEPAEAVA